MRRALFLISLLLMIGCTGQPPSEPKPSDPSPPVVEPTASTPSPPVPPVSAPESPPAVNFTVDGISFRGDWISAGKHEVRVDFAEPADRSSAERQLYEGAAPIAVDWAETDRAVTLTYDLKHGEWVLIHTREVRSQRGPAFAESYLKLRAVGKATLWRQDIGGKPVRIVTLDDTFERLYAAPGGQVLALSEVAEEGYMDFYRVALINPSTGVRDTADVSVNDAQGMQNPRWWPGGMLISGITWGMHRVDWTGANIGGVPAVPKGPFVRATGVSPAGKVAVLISDAPDRDKQVPAALLVGEKVYRGVALLPPWPKNRADTHYWPHFEILWLSEQEVIIPDLSSHFTGGREWRRVDLLTGESRPYPLLKGLSSAYPAGDGKRFMGQNEQGWAVVEEGKAPVRVALSPHDQRQAVWAPPVWSKDGATIYWGSLTINPGTGSVRAMEIPSAPRRIARDAAGRIYWLESDNP